MPLSSDRRTNEPYYRFQRLVEALFWLHDFKVEADKRISLRDDGRPYEIDLLVTSPAGAKSVIDVKLYRSRTPNPLDLSNACQRLLAAQAAVGADHAVLATNLNRSHTFSDDALPGGVVLFPFDEMLDAAKSDVELEAGLTEIGRELNSALRDFDRPVDDGASASRRADAPDTLQTLVSLRSADAPVGPSGPPPSRKGHELAAELRELPSGSGFIKLSSEREGVAWRLFEQICQEGLSYIFQGLLDQWEEQQAVGGDANRFDAMCKITGDDVFSRTLIEDFSSRYILFEFKNYTDAVKPNLIHITEKYLYPRALRGTAIIISPQGLSLDARAATHGALRDVGKLVLDLNVDTLCKMLEDKDNGTAPSATMEGLLDAFLLEIGR
ncbi:restriction endonuclease [Caulobacter sp. 602-2]|uniref:Restriction endonuclease n=1 Tax=Caulobacter sp. 602-2 TaxID=2710887 RepID=A0A6G4QS17_9CAUL|nr:restriction endonuclease [Caulobacter sp. 602-2]NGM48446.1 restriction endonuclease [Caulobacter sp. 602-2]